MIWALWDPETLSSGSETLRPCPLGPLGLRSSSCWRPVNRFFNKNDISTKATSVSESKQLLDEVTDFSGWLRGLKFLGINYFHQASDTET